MGYQAEIGNRNEINAQVELSIHTALKNRPQTGVMGLNFVYE